MYNRYIPQGDFIPAESAEQGGRENRPPRRSGLPGGLFTGVPDLNGLLKMLHLDNFKDCHPYALSGGQKQRLTIGAAMLSEKPIIVLDEPTSGLDWDNMCAVANAVNYMREAGKLVFIITHDLEFISLTASRALLLKEGIIKDDLQMTEQNNFKIVKNFMVEEGGE